MTGFLIPQKEYKVAAVVKQQQQQELECLRCMKLLVYYKQ